MSSPFIALPVLAWKSRFAEKPIVAARNGKINNENFVKTAPQDVLDKNKTALEDINNKLQHINSELDKLK